MREIKFKYILKLGSDLFIKIFSLDDIQDGKHEIWIKEKHLEKYSQDSYLDYELERCQYTGLKDKNNVKIYEGDIVKYKICTKDKNIFILEIEYEEELARFYIRGRYSESSVIFCFLSAGAILDAEIEVIGNIYENLELLGQEK